MSLRRSGDSCGRCSRLADGTSRTEVEAATRVQRARLSCGGLLFALGNIRTLPRLPFTTSATAPGKGAC